MEDIIIGKYYVGFGLTSESSIANGNPELLRPCIEELLHRANECIKEPGLYQIKMIVIKCGDD
jgi:hypothetical protein